VPAMVFNGRNDLLAANAMGRAPLPGVAGKPPGRRNGLRYLFRDPDSREFYRDREKAARQSVANLRAATGQDADDPDTRALIGELSSRSEEFRVWWARRDVRACLIGHTDLRHPQVGELGVDHVGMPLPDPGDQVLVTYAAPAGSPAPDGLDLLAMLCGQRVSE
jgi:hypothetical protein